MIPASAATPAPNLIPLRFYLQVEGLVALVLATGFYAHESFSWGFYAALFFVPDLFMLGYLAGPRIGAIIYNLGHTYTLPAVVLLIAHLSGSSTLAAIGLIWCAHIGFDRLVGYGLKNDSGFKDTHFTSLR